MAQMETSQPQGNQRHGKKRAKKSSTHVDMTPMVDLGFLLLTFFVLTSTFNKPQAMEINMPVPADNAEQRTKFPADRTINLILGENNAVYYYMGVFDPANKPTLEQTSFGSDGIRTILLEKNRAVMQKVIELKQQLDKGELSKEEYKKLSAEAKKDKKGLIVLIKALDKAKYTNVVDILDEMQIANIGRYALVDVTDMEAALVKQQPN